MDIKMKQLQLCCTEDFPYVILRLDSAVEKNLLDTEGMKQLIACLEQYAQDVRCEVIILTGTEDYFCFGGNLDNRCKQTVAGILQFSDLLATLHQRIAGYPKTTIAAINGKVGGGGVSLVDSCDFAVSTADASFEFPELHTGSAPMISLMGVRNSIPKKWCYEMMFAQKISAHRLKEMGLINEITENVDVVQATKDYWDTIPRHNQQAFALCKRYYLETQGLDYAKQLEMGKCYLVSMLKGE